MRFDTQVYGPEVTAILALDGEGNRPMPLTADDCAAEAVKSRLAKADARSLFPDARSADAALSGLWLYFDCFEESHRISQEIHTSEGSFWHGIAHRREPDPGNAAYWFRRVGSHPVFPELRERAAAIIQSNSGVSLKPGAAWDPFAFIDFCERARQAPGSTEERAAREIQLAEWQLLFDYCARPVR